MTVKLLLHHQHLINGMKKNSTWIQETTIIIPNPIQTLMIRTAIPTIIQITIDCSIKNIELGSKFTTQNANIQNQKQTWLVLKNKRNTCKITSHVHSVRKQIPRANLHNGNTQKNNNQNNGKNRVKTWISKKAQNLLENGSTNQSCRQRNGMIN